MSLGKMGGRHRGGDVLVYIIWLSALYNWEDGFGPDGLGWAIASVQLGLGDTFGIFGTSARIVILCGVSRGAVCSWEWSCPGGWQSWADLVRRQMLLEVGML